MPNLIISSIIFSIQGLQHRKNDQAKSNSQYIMWVNKSRNLCHTRVPSCIFKKSLWCQEKVSCGFSSTGTIFNSIYDMLYLIRLNVSLLLGILQDCAQRNLHWCCQRISITNNCQWMPIHTSSDLLTRWCATKRTH